jgi:hypothetical protein
LPIDQLPFDQMANYRVEVRGWERDSGLQLQGLIALSLLSYIANITMLLIKSTILLKGHLDFDLVNEQDRLELKERGQFKVAS